MQVLNGRYGPYITDGEKNARIPKDKEPKELTADECAALLAAAPNRPKRGGRFNRGAKTAAKTEAAPTAKEAKAATKKARAIIARLHLLFFPKSSAHPPHAERWTSRPM